MGYPTPIEWTDATWNPIGGCSINSPGCAPCYAQQLAGTRLAHHPLYAGTTTTVKGKPVFNGRLTAAPDDHPVWSWPISWRGAKAPLLGPGQPSLIFVGDMSDLFHEHRSRAVQDKVIASVAYSRHIGQLLTKRPGVMLDYMVSLMMFARRGMHDLQHPLFKKSNFAPEATSANVIVPKLWLGMSAERQQEFDARWPYMRSLSRMGFTVFVSYEPAIGPLVLPDDFLALGKRAQVIAGGMSGREATPAHPDWFRAVRDQCDAAGVAFFLKQWGEHLPLPGYTADGEYLVPQDPDTPADIRRHHNLTGDQVWRRVGKKAAGRLLDGRTHDALPERAA